MYIWETERACFRGFAADENGKRKFVFLGRQMVNGNRRVVSANVPHLCVYSMYGCMYSMNVCRSRLDTSSVKK